MSQLTNVHLNNLLQSRPPFVDFQSRTIPVQFDISPAVKEKKSLKKMSGPSSPTGGVQPMAIAGRMVRERERLVGMTDEERAWRRQWVKDQELSHHEPRRVPALDAEFQNPIRRFYRAPLDKLCDALTPTLGFSKAWGLRFWIGKGLLIATGIYAGAYYFKYNQNDWTRKGGWRVIHNRSVCHPGDAEFPKLSDRSVPQDYAARGFKQSPI